MMQWTAVMPSFLVAIIPMIQKNLNLTEFRK